MFTANEAKEIALRKMKEEEARKAAKEAARNAKKWNVFDSIELFQTLFWIKHAARRGNTSIHHHLPTRPHVIKKLKDNGYGIHYDYGYGDCIYWGY